MVLILLITFSNYSAIADEGFVSISQGGSSEEPFDAGRDIFYDVEISNSGHPMHYAVNLEIGPDSSDTSISKSFHQDIDVNQVSSGTTRFKVNFIQSSDLGRGEFGEWLENESETGIWTKAWYRVTFDSLDPFNKIEAVEDFSGKPSLVKPLWKLRNPKVTPRTGTNDEVFEYKVDMLSNALDNLTLEVAPSRDGQWTSLGTIKYTTPGEWQTLRWSNKTLNFDFEAAYYRFIGRQQETFNGPFWPVVWEFKNASVMPESGTSEKYFDYFVEINASNPADVVLHVLDVATGEYQPIGRKPYINTSSWEPLAWKDVKVTEQDGALGLSSYYFTVHYPGLDAAIDDSTNRTVFPNPSITIGDVTGNVLPQNGTAFTKFTFMANLSLKRPICDIELWVLPPGSNIWIPKGVATYTQDNRNLVWSNISLDGASDSLGMARYKFTMDNTLLGEFKGPNIDVAFRGAGDYVRVGSGRFNYHVQVRSIHPRLCIDMVVKGDKLEFARLNKPQCYVSDNQSWKDLVWNEGRFQEWYFIDMRDCTC